MLVIGKQVQAILTKNLLDLIILQLIERQPMHGYEILCSIRSIYGVSLSASSLYPLLNFMEKEGYLISSWSMNSKRPKKTYKLTSGGKSLLEDSMNSLHRICNLMDSNGINKKLLSGFFK